MIGRVATFSASQLALTQSLNTQAKLAEAQTQQSSGLKSDSFSGMADNASAFFAFTAQASRLNADIASGQNFSQRLNQTYSTLGCIADLATTIRTAIAATQSGTSESSGITNNATQWRNDLTSLLNTKFGGAYLFGGEATQSAPVDLSGYDSASATSDTPLLTYYKGADTTQTLTTSSFNTDQPVTAGDSGFEKLFRATSLLSNGSDTDTLTSAYDLVTQAVTEIAGSQALVSARANATNSFVTSAQAQLSFAQDSADDAKSVDLAAATLHVTQFQTQLEAAYSSLTALMKVNLLDYLR